MRTGSCNPVEAVVISGTWPTEDRGYSIAVAASLREYVKYFERVHFLGPAREPFADRPSWAGAAIHWATLPLVGGAKWGRFLHSLVSHDPAVTVRYRAAARHFRRQMVRLVADTRNRGHEPVVIYEDVPAACFLRWVRHNFPDVRQAVRSHNCLVQGFAGLSRQGSLVHRLAWQIELAKIRRFEQSVFRSADVFWAITDDDAAVYERHFGSRPAGVLGISMDVPRYGGVPSGEPATVVHIGSADLRKGLGLREFLARGWPLVRARVPHARFVVGGRDTESLSNPLLGVEGLGFVRDDRDVLSRGLVFLNPQQIGAGIKVKSVTAMLSGKALVSTPNGIEGVAGSDGRHFFAADDAEGLARRIVALMESPRRALAVGGGARALATTEYSPAALSRVVQPLLEAFVRGPAPADRGNGTQSRAI